MNKFDDFGQKLGKWVLSHKLLTFLLVIVTVIASVGGAKYISFETSYRVFFSSGNPQLKAWDELQLVYNKTDNAVFVLKPKEGDVFTHEILAAVKEITEKSWKLPFSTRVDSITNYQHTEAIEDNLIIEDLVEGNPNDLTQQELDKIRNIALNEPLLAKRIVSENGDTTGVNVSFNFPEKDMFEITDTATKIRELLAEVQAKYPDIKMVVSGVVMMNDAFATSSKKDMMELAPIMYLMLILAMILFLRSIMATIAVVFVIAFSAMTAMGLTGWLGINLTPPSATAPTVILTLAIADSIHIIVSMMKEMSRHGLSKNDAIIESMRINLQPVFLTSFTTAIGFLTLNFSDAPPFHDLGNITAMGVTAAFIYSILLLPVLLSVLPIKASKKIESEDKEYMHKLANFIIEKHKILFKLSLVLTIGLGAMIPRIELNDQFVQYFDQTIQFRPDSEFMMNNLTGIYNIEYSLKAKDAQGINDPEYLQNLENYANWLRTQPEVSHVHSMADIFKRLNKNMHGDDQEYYKLPESRRLAAQYLLLYEFSLPYGLDLNDRINVDKSATRLTATLKDMSTKSIRAFKIRSENWLKENTPSYMHTESTSPIIMFSYISEQNIDSMNKGNTIALVLISFCIMIALKSVRIGFISLIPNIVPIIMGFGIWGIMIGQVNMAAAVITSVSLGIIVDDTIHFLSKYSRARREKGLNSEDAIRYAFATVGSALFVTTIVLIVGFSVLILSGFAINKIMGMLTVIIIAFAFIADFFLLPSLLMLLDKNKGKEGNK
jgi:predicted RND superfamily exporter protein